MARQQFCLIAVCALALVRCSLAGRLLTETVSLPLSAETQSILNKEGKKVIDGSKTIVAEIEREVKTPLSALGGAASIAAKIVKAFEHPMESTSKGPARAVLPTLDVVNGRDGLGLRSAFDLKKEHQDCNGSIAWPAFDHCDSKIQYNGGPLLSEEPLTVHLILYGDWSTYGGKDVDVITSFVESLSDKSADAKGPSVKKWWDISTKYTDGEGKEVADEVVLGKVVKAGGEYAKGLNDGGDGNTDDIIKIVLNSIGNGDLPKDTSALYVVLTSADVKVGNASDNYAGGFCDSYCGWHYFSTLDDGANLTYAFVGNAEEQCPRGCTPFNVTLGSPNGYFGADSLITVLAHEITEAATDPYITGWYSEKGWENGDLCAWVFTDTFKHPDLLEDDGISYNMYGINDYKYLVQANVDPIKQVCVVQGDSAE